LMALMTCSYWWSEGAIVLDEGWHA
jgi:hypothetical protein